MLRRLPPLATFASMVGASIILATPCGSAMWLPLRSIVRFASSKS